MPRSICPHCHYPLTTCCCAVLDTIEHQTQIDILQHPTEATAAKNTAHLCQLSLAHCRIWCGEQPEDFATLQQQLANEHKAIALLYPGDSATPIQEFALQPSPIRLLLIDATWGKAYKMLQLNPWLQQFAQLKLPQSKGQYHIRKAPKAGQLSTLEAIRLALHQLEPEVNSTPLLRLFEHRKAVFMKYRPAHLQTHKKTAHNGRLRRGTVKIRTP